MEEGGDEGPVILQAGGEGSAVDQGDPMVDCGIRELGEVSRLGESQRVCIDCGREEFGELLRAPVVGGLSDEDGDVGPLAGGIGSA
jgi:hypothetical protein